MSSLYKISQELDNAIEECVDMETGEITNPARLDELTMALIEKRENVALYIKNKVSEIDAIANEIKNLTARKKVLTNRVDSLKAYLADNLAGKKFETARVAISYRKSDSLEIKTIKFIPAEYFIVQEPKIDKVGLKKLVKTGVVIDGVELVSKQNIQIK